MIHLLTFQTRSFVSLMTGHTCYYALAGLPGMGTLSLGPVWGRVRAAKEAL